MASTHIQLCSTWQGTVLKRRSCLCLSWIPYRLSRHTHQNPTVLMNYPSCYLRVVPSCHPILSKNRFTIVIKLCPLKESAPLLPRHIPSVTHPKVLSPILLLSLHNPQDSWNITLTPRRKFRMQACLVISVCDVDSFVSRNWMWINGLCWRYAVFPLLLHLGVHD